MNTTGRKIATTASVAASAAKVIFLRPVGGRDRARLPHFCMTINILHHHHRVVDDETDCQRQPEEGEGVEGVPEEVDDRDGPEERPRDRQHHVERRRERAQEQPADECRQHQREHQLELDLVHRLLDERRRVEEDLDLHPLGQVLGDLGDLLAHRARHHDGVRAALLEDAERLQRHPVEPRDRGHVLEAVLDERDVLEVDRRLLHAADDELAQRLEIERLAEQPHVQLPTARVEQPARHLDVLAPNCVDHVGGDDALFRHAARIEPDAHVAVEISVQRDLPDARHRLQLLLHLVARDVGEHLSRERTRDADGEDRRVVGVQLRDRCRRHVAWELPLRLRDARLHVLQREVDVARDVEERRHPRLSLPRGGCYLLDTFDLRDRLLERLDDLALDGARRRARPREAHRNVRVVDVRILADADARDGDEAEEHRRPHQHPGEDGVLDRDVGEVHRSAPPSTVARAAGVAGPSASSGGVDTSVARTFAPSASASAPRTTTRSPSFRPDRTSTQPSRVDIPSDNTRSRATAPSTT
jgi:hypothetical protein